MVRTTVTQYPARPACDCCGTVFGSDTAVRVMYPTRNPKRVRSEYLCHGCYDTTEGDPA